MDDGCLAAAAADAAGHLAQGTDGHFRTGAAGSRALGLDYGDDRFGIVIFRQILKRRKLQITVRAAAPGSAVLGHALPGNDLREDRDRDLRRGDGTDVQPDGGTDLAEAVRVKALFLQHLEQASGTTARADHAQIGRIFASQQDAQAVGVMPMPAGDDHHIIKGCHTEAADPVFKAVADNLCGIGKAAAVGEFRPVVHDVDLEAALRGKLADRQRDVPAAQNEQALLRHDGLTHGQRLSVIFRRHPRKTAPLRVGNRADAVKQRAAHAVGNTPLPAFDDGFDRDRFYPADLFHYFSIDIGHGFNSCSAFLRSALRLDNDVHVPVWPRRSYSVGGWRQSARQSSPHDRPG